MKTNDNADKSRKLQDVHNAVRDINNNPELLTTVFNSIPVIVLLFNVEAELVGANKTALEAFNKDFHEVFMRRGGELLSCIHSFEKGGCGGTEACGDCPVRTSIVASITGGDIQKKQVVLTVLNTEKEELQKYFLLTARHFNHKGEDYSILMVEDIDELVQLRKMIPICSSCKKIRDDKDYWNSVEEYFYKESEVLFTHSVCPSCFKKLYPELADN